MARLQQRGACDPGETEANAGRQEGAEQAVDDAQTRQPHEPSRTAGDASKMAARRPLASTAPPRLNSGEYGECEPPDRSSGATSASRCRRRRSSPAPPPRPGSRGRTLQCQQQDQHDDHEVDERHLGQEIRRWTPQTSPGWGVAGLCGRADGWVVYTVRVIAATGHPARRRSRRALTRAVPLALAGAIAVVGGVYLLARQRARNVPSCSVTRPTGSTATTAGCGRC